MRTRRTTWIVLTLAATLVGMLLPGTAAHAITCTTPSGVSGTIKYISPSGNDSNSGSISAPWKTFDASFNKLQPGWTLLADGGDYWGPGGVGVPHVAIKRSNEGYDGTSSSRIAVRSCAGENPVIIGQLKLESADYWTIDNIDVKGTKNLNGGDYVLVEFWNGRHWEFKNSHVWDGWDVALVAVSGGVNISEPVGGKIINNCIHDVNSNGTGPNDETLFMDHTIYVVYGRYGSSQSLEVTQNRLFDAPYGAGIKVGNGANGTADNVTFHRNTIYNTAKGALAVGSSSNFYLYRNIIEKTHTNKFTGYKFSLIMGHSHSGSNNRYRSNLGWNSASGKWVGYQGTSPTTTINDAGENYYADPGLPDTPTCTMEGTGSGANYGAGANM